MMIQWLYQLDVPAMAACIAAASYLLVWIITLLVRTLARRGWAPAFKAISPVTLTPLAVIFGLLVGFLTNQVWNDAAGASAAVTREAGALRTLVVLAASLDPEHAEQVRGVVRDHIRSAVEDEWPAMADHRADWRSIKVDDSGALAVLLALPSNAGHAQVRSALIGALREAQQARRERIVISQSYINPVKWSVLILLAVLLLSTIAMIHCDNPRASLLSMAVFATGVAACLTLIASHNHPFTGEISISPQLLQQALPD